MVVRTALCWEGAVAELLPLGLRFARHFAMDADQLAWATVKWARTQSGQAASLFSEITELALVVRSDRVFVEALMAHDIGLRWFREGCSGRPACLSDPEPCILEVRDEPARIVSGWGERPPSAVLPPYLPQLAKVAAPAAPEAPVVAHRPPEVVEAIAPQQAPAVDSGVVETKEAVDTASNAEATSSASKASEPQEEATDKTTKKKKKSKARREKEKAKSKARMQEFREQFRAFNMAKAEAKAEAKTKEKVDPENRENASPPKTQDEAADAVESDQGSASKKARTNVAATGEAAKAASPVLQPRDSNEKVSDGTTSGNSDMSRVAEDAQAENLEALRAIRVSELPLNYAEAAATPPQAKQ